MSTYNNQLWAKMVTDWIMAAPPPAPRDASADDPAQLCPAVPRVGCEANAASRMQPVMA